MVRKENVTYQFNPEWFISPESGSIYSYHFYIKTINSIIEVDGDQRFIQIANWEHPARPL